ncbi:MAG: NADH:flavin oxidoreductase [Phaeodactylibacter xiamenensis]|uniref:NADH:flavin oxidoreductase n=1 Tax=Phaeodactylibacter xiamenensis TaxID=1524460 RepID=A0A098SB75_9BACT|nr:NADH:flavin oxidoreductase [Phaeodactylibacter xiamenensis]KGE89375.1 NADH:flavin oxidoreductase [Phaeodactylibacter xiamenensis]MCR9055514.1 NADH:flavin oxidoreductase [bacterium]
MPNSVSLSTPLTFPCGKTMKNRFMLAPMTNKQSHEDGTLSDDEYHWLTMRAKGQFGLVMTCASNVQPDGKCWPGQLGIYHDKHLEGHQRLAAGIQAHGSLAVVQLHHGGMRCPAELIGDAPVAPSDSPEESARGLSLHEVEQLRDDFIAAARRAQQAGYDGVEVHGAHGYILTQFLSPEHNRRQDHYGGDLDNRARLLFEIVQGIRAACGKGFLLGVRLSPERFGMEPTEVKTLSQQLIDSGAIDFLDLSLWDVFKPSEFSGQSLLAYFADLDRRSVRLTAAGKIHGAREARQTLEAGMDFVAIGKSAILHHDFPAQVLRNPDFRPVSTPVSKAHLEREGLGPAFIDYMERWEGFVEG